MTTFLLLLKCFFWSILSTLLRVVLPSVTILLLKYSFKILFTPLFITALDILSLKHVSKFEAIFCYYTARVGCGDVFNNVLDQ